MSDAPKRICAFPDYNDHTNPVSEDWDFGNWDSGICVHRGTEYVRADIHAAEVEALRKENERLTEALVDLVNLYPYEDEKMGLVCAAHDRAFAALQGETG